MMKIKWYFKICTLSSGGASFVQGTANHLGLLLGSWRLCGRLGTTTTLTPRALTLRLLLTTALLRGLLLGGSLLFGRLARLARFAFGLTLRAAFFGSHDDESRLITWYLRLTRVKRNVFLSWTNNFKSDLRNN